MEEHSEGYWQNMEGHNEGYWQNMEGLSKSYWQNKLNKKYKVLKKTNNKLIYSKKLTIYSFQGFKFLINL